MLQTSKTNLSTYAKYFPVIILSTVLFLSTYYMLMPVLPVHMEAMGANTMQIAAVMGVFSVSSLVLRPVTGQLADAYGKKRLMIVSVLLFLVTPVLYRLGASLWLIAFVQVFYGFAIGGFTIASTAYVTDLAPAQYVSRVIGQLSIALILAKGLAPALGYRLWAKMGFGGVLTVTTAAALLAGMLVIRLGEVRPPERGRSKTPFTTVIMRREVVFPTLTLFSGMVTFGAITTLLPLVAMERNLANIGTFFVIHTLAVIATRLVTGRMPDRYLPALVKSSIISSLRTGRCCSIPE